MGLLKNTWVVAIVALVINLGVVMGMLLMNYGPMVEEAKKARAAAVVEPEDPLDPAFWTLQFSKFDDMLAAVEAREKAVAEREARVEERETGLQVARDELEAIRAELVKNREDLRAMMLEVDASEQKNLKYLATTYMAMPPNQLVPIINELSDEQAIKVLLQMKPDALAGIFAAMVANDPEGKQARRVADFSKDIRRFRREAETAAK